MDGKFNGIIFKKNWFYQIGKQLEFLILHGVRSREANMTNLGIQTVLSYCEVFLLENMPKKVFVLIFTNYEICLNFLPLRDHCKIQLIDNGRPSR